MTASADARLEFSLPQLRVLLTAIGFLIAGEWSETITASEFQSLMAADKKIRAALAAEGEK